ncbi:hypothetical protein ACI796_22750 [Geodermatophilus sp. SYSU D00525]
MTEPTRPRPVPGPPRPGPAGVPARPVPAGPVVDAAAADRGTDASERPGTRFADLAQRPVGEHVAVFEAEHDRLKRELGTIDQL